MRELGHPDGLDREEVVRHLVIICGVGVIVVRIDVAALELTLEGRKGLLVDAGELGVILVEVTRALQPEGEPRFAEQCAQALHVEFEGQAVIHVERDDMPVVRYRNQQHGLFLVRPGSRGVAKRGEHAFPAKDRQPSFARIGAVTGIHRGELDLEGDLRFGHTSEAIQPGCSDPGGMPGRRTSAPRCRPRRSPS